MSGPAAAGLFVYAKDLEPVACFYQSLLGMQRLHATPDIVVLQSQDVQLVVHKIPAHIAAEIEIAVPPVPREDAALKFFFSVPSIAAARSAAAILGGRVMDTVYQGTGFQVCNACDPEGNIFHVREHQT
jgi:catechol 2,3-dioxygenase-like lactoylglutathione lyase family enzyme